jgi:alkylation response protein AidB-like acyl-CoA dehydrogenase
VREFAEAELRPHVREWDEAQHYPRDLLARCADLGLMGIQFAEEYGAGKTFLTSGTYGELETGSTALAFAAEGKVKPTIETHPLESVNEVFTLLKSGRVNGRIVLGIGKQPLGERFGFPTVAA